MAFRKPFRTVPFNSAKPCRPEAKPAERTPAAPWQERDAKSDLVYL